MWLRETLNIIGIPASSSLDAIWIFDASSSNESGILLIGFMIRGIPASASSDLTRCASWAPIITMFKLNLSFISINFNKSEALCDFIINGTLSLRILNKAFISLGWSSIALATAHWPISS